MPMKIKNMKGIDLSCASPASTAICSSTKSLQRLNTYIGDQYKTLSNNISNTYSSPSRAPCISELPFTPRPSSFSSYREKTRKITSIVKHSDVVTRRRSSADVTDIKRYNYKKNSYDDHHDNTTSHSSRYLLGESKYLDSLLSENGNGNGNGNVRNYQHCSKINTKRNDTNSFQSLPSTPVFGSEGRRSTSRIETRRFGSLLDAEKEKIRSHFSLIDVSGGGEERKIKSGMQQRNAGETYCDNSGSLRQRSMGHSHSCRNDSLVRKSSSSTTRSRDQVVVLRVSLHCKGCEGKLRKHLSKMEGVTSYIIDMETKKVTVTGSVTPSEVLTSISKVKNAQFWPSQASNSSTSSSSSSNSSSLDFN